TDTTRFIASNRQFCDRNEFFFSEFRRTFAASSSRSLRRPMLRRRPELSDLFRRENLNHFPGRRPPSTRFGTVELSGSSLVAEGEESAGAARFRSIIENERLGRPGRRDSSARFARTPSSVLCRLDLMRLACPPIRSISIIER